MFQDYFNLLPQCAGFLFQKVPVLIRDTINENILMDDGCHEEANTHQLIFRHYMPLTCYPLYLIGNGA